MRRTFFTLAALVTLAACSPFPDLGPAGGERVRAAPYPALLPLERILARAGPQGQIRAELGNLPARLARLRERARWLRNRQVVDDATRARMQAALARHN